MDEGRKMTVATTTADLRRPTRRPASPLDTKKRDRLWLRMHEELGMTVREIAHVYGVTLRAVQYGLNRARVDSPQAVPTWEALGEDLSYIESHPKYQDPAVKDWLMSLRHRRD